MSSRPSPPVETTLMLAPTRPDPGLDTVIMSHVRSRPGGGQTGGGAVWSRSQWWRCGVLVIVTAVTAASACALVTALYLHSSRHHSVVGERVCMTPECVTTAASLLAAMDTSVDPCEDFFQFACGKYNKEHTIPEDRSSISTFEVLSDKLQVIIRGLLEEKIGSMNDSEATIKAKKFYKSCANTGAIRRVGEGPLRRVLRQLGGWPVLDPLWQPPSNMSLEVLLGRVRSTFNLGVIFELWIGPDDRNSSINVIQMDQMSLALPSRDYFLNERYSGELASYRQFMTDVAILMGAEADYARQQMKLVLQLDIQLSNASVPEADRHDTGAIYTPMSLPALQQAVPHVAWQRFLSSMLHVPLTDHEPVVVYSMPFLRRVDSILHQADPRVVHNYVLWRLIRHIIPYMTPPYQQLLSNFRKVLLGIPSDRKRWNLCVEWTNQYFGMAVGALFIREKFNEESKRTAVEMIATLREAFIELLSENQWMDDATRLVAKEKALAINRHIGYPDFISRPRQLDKEYKKIEVAEDRFLENVLDVLYQRAQANIGRLRKPVPERRWTSEPPVVVVNAFYNPNKNDIVFPAGILQPLFYSRYFPKSLNYGGIGVVIGHEITHGFDDKGRQFDKHGNMKQWWNNATIRHFRQQTQCMVRQYSQYQLPDIGLYVNGKMTRGENIADNGGLKQAFRAYRRWVSQHGEEPLLPGIHLSHDQLFFLNYAQIWCGKMRPEDAESKIMSSVHAPGPVRVLGPLSNSHDFARAYQCPRGSRMNPVNKCTVW